jgi:serine/threonine protein kinase
MTFTELFGCAVHRLEQERDILKKCIHGKGKERVMQLKGVDTAKLLLYFELAPGGSLKNILEDSPGEKMTQSEAKTWIIKTIDVALYLHDEQNVAHNDLKAENMLVFGNSRNRLKAGDMESAAEIGSARSQLVSP